MKFYFQSPKPSNLYYFKMSNPADTVKEFSINGDIIIITSETGEQFVLPKYFKDANRNSLIEKAKKRVAKLQSSQSIIYHGKFLNIPKILARSNKNLYFGRNERITTSTFESFIVENDEVIFENMVDSDFKNYLVEPKDYPSGVKVDYTYDDCEISPSGIEVSQKKIRKKLIEKEYITKYDELSFGTYCATKNIENYNEQVSFYYGFISDLFKKKSEPIIPEKSSVEEIVGYYFSKPSTLIKVFKSGKITYDSNATEPEKISTVIENTLIGFDDEKIIINCAGKLRTFNYSTIAFAIESTSDGGLILGITNGEKITETFQIAIFYMNSKSSLRAKIEKHVAEGNFPNMIIN